MMNRAWFLLLMMAIAPMGCVGGKAIERSYFSLQYVLGEDDRAQGEPHLPFTIRVARFTAGLAYDRQEIVYRSNPHEFQYYWYKLWAAKPEKLAREQVVAHLAHSNLLEDVHGGTMDALPDYELRCHVNALEELDSVEGRWFAHLDLTFSLIRISDGTKVFETRFDGKKEVFEKRPVFVVRALSELLQEQSRALVAELASTLGKETRTHKSDEVTGDHADHP